MQDNFDLSVSVSAQDENDCMLPSGILGKHQSVSGRILFGCLFKNPGSVIQYVCFEGVLMICSSHSLSGCKYYVHSTLYKVGKPTGQARSLSALHTTNFHISLGNPAQERYGMNTQHEKFIFNI